MIRDSLIEMYVFKPEFGGNTYIGNDVIYEQPTKHARE